MRSGIVVIILIGIGGAIGGYRFLFSPPADFPSGSMLTIARGATVPAIAEELARDHIIARPSVLRFILRVSGESSRMREGTYLFAAPENVFTIAYRLVTGDSGLPLVRLTFPEGETTRDLAKRVHDAFPAIAEADFLSAARQHEGYLFPDTYFFQPSVSSAAILKALRANFDAKIAPFARDVQGSGRSLSDIVIMASLVEREARITADKRMVAGIIANRLAQNMPLQVDAVFGYIYDRDTYSPSFSDLKVDSPYNTYLHTGLPPGPISNPGLDSIEAVLHPTETDYFYYLTGRDGLMHYAITYASHQENRRKYLN